MEADYYTDTYHRCGYGKKQIGKNFLEPTFTRDCEIINANNDCTFYKQKGGN